MENHDAAAPPSLFRGLFAPFLLAVQFLTRLPVPSAPFYDEQTVGRSLLYYPLVGLLIGAMLAAAAHLLHAFDPLLAAALLLTLWVLVSGGLHLDGLADSADAWLGGHGSRERSLEIMKDPAAGPAGVMVIVLTLLLKFAALTVALRGDLWWLLVAVPVVGRTVLLPLFLTTPYVRPGGLGEMLSQGMPRGGARWMLMVVLFIIAAFGPSGLAMLFAALALFFWARAMMLKRLGGTTGDTAGALVEMVEAGALVAALLAR